MYGAIAFYDWMIEENREVGILPPDFGMSDSSVGGTPVGSIGTMQQELMTETYGRIGMDRSSGEVFQLDITTNTPVLGQTLAVYGAIAALGVKVRVNGTNTYVDSKVTITVDPQAGSHGAGATYSQVVLLAAADAEGRGTYPNRNAVVFPWDVTDTVRRNGGRGGTSVNKIRIMVEPRAGTGGSTGVVIYDVLMTRVMIPRCFFGGVANGSLADGVEDLSDVQRAYAGYPYVSKKPVLRRTSAQFTDISKAFVYGTEGTTDVAASIRAVNGFAGASTNIIFSPRLAPPASEQSSGQFRPAWSNEHILGLLDDPLNAILQTVTTTAKKMLWSASFSVTETPLP